MSGRILQGVVQAARTQLWDRPIHQIAMVSSWPKHLKKGDKQPPLEEGRLRLYSMRFCPYAQRTHLVLDIKKIPYDTVNANLTEKPEWLFSKSFGAKVPAIEFEDGGVLSESLILADYLDEVYPEPALYPKDARAKAKEKLLIEKFSAVTRCVFKLIHGKDESEKLQVRDELISELKYFEEELTKRNTTFFGGSKPGMFDLMTWPWFERFPLIADASGVAFTLESHNFPKLTALRDAMLSNEAVKLSYLPPEYHAKFWVSRQVGEYDFTL